MSYVRGSYKGVGLIGGIMVALVIAFFFFGPGLIRNAARQDASTPEGFEARMLRDPFAGGAFAVLNETHPKEMRTFFEEGARHVREGATKEQLAEYGNQFLRKLSLAQADRIAHAPFASLTLMTRTNSVLLDKLRAANTDRCAAFAARGQINLLDLSPDEIKAANDAAAARWRAAAAGRDHPEAAPAKAERADIEALSAAMRSDGATESDIRLFMAGDMAAIPPNSQCEIGFHLYHALLAMPRVSGEPVMRQMFGAT